MLLEDQVGPIVVGHFVVVGHRQRAGRAGFDAEPASDAAQVVDLVDAAVAFARRETLLLGVVGALDVDRVGRARPCAQFAADALLQAVGVAVKLMTAVVARLHRARIFRVALGDGPSEHRAERDAESGERTQEFSHVQSPCSPTPATGRAVAAWEMPAPRTLRTLPPPARCGAG